MERRLESLAVDPDLAASKHQLSINSLPDELILHILSYLDIPELHITSRTSHRLRHLSLDPLLHAARLSRVSLTLAVSIPARPSLADLIYHRIYITRTTLAARNLGRKLIKIKLTRLILRRPSAASLVEKGVLPKECLPTAKREAGFLAPSLIETKRKIEREKVKDILRGWMEEWRRKGRKRAVKEIVDVENHTDVRRLARRFASGSSSYIERDGYRERRWGGKDVAIKEEPTRAKVSGLRKFWERVGREDVRF